MSKINIIVSLKAPLIKLLKDLNDMGQTKPEKYSRSGRSQENIDYIRASVVENNKMFIRQRWGM